MRRLWFFQLQVSPSSAPAMVPGPPWSSLGLLLSMRCAEAPREGGLLGTVIEILTRVSQSTLLPDKLLCRSADTPSPERKGGGHPRLPATYPSQCHSAETGLGIEMGQTLSFNKHLMSTCSVPDVLLGENKTKADLILPAAALPPKPQQPVSCWPQ